MKGPKARQNKIEIEGDIAKIWLHGKYGDGKYAIIDIEDINKIDKYNWYLDINSGRNRKSKTERCVKTVRYVNKVKKNIFIHRLVLHCKNNQFVDHINGDVKDNRKSNLRICTNSQNQMNRKYINNKTSRFKGVYKRKIEKKWGARITKNKKNTHIGYFDNEIDAAKAYDKKAKELFGEFACTNEMLGLY